MRASPVDGRGARDVEADMTTNDEAGLLTVLKECRVTLDEICVELRDRGLIDFFVRLGAIHDELHDVIIDLEIEDDSKDDPRLLMWENLE